LRTSSPQDLILDVTLECSIITDVLVPGTTNQGAVSSGSSEGQIRVWVVIDGNDTGGGYIVPISDIGTKGTHDVGSDDDKVTFCNRENRITITDTEDPKDGTDQQENYLKTKDANAFNWLALNLGSGIHTVEVRADFTGTNTDGSTSAGFIGNRTLIVQPAKLANDSAIS
ncbi:MAG: hypothetical protein LC723_13850, partial [Actinobacteria bacterium]|nr:hypothetical protein [Actinomycetota bacterium]